MADSIQQRIDKLDEAISSGVKSVFSDGERIEFQSIADMIAARNDLVRQASAQAGGRSPWRNFNQRPTMRW